MASTKCEGSNPNDRAEGLLANRRADGTKADTDVVYKRRDTNFIILKSIGQEMIGASLNGESIANNKGTSHWVCAEETPMSR